MGMNVAAPPAPLGGMGVGMSMGGMLPMGAASQANYSISRLMSPDGVSTTTPSPPKSKTIDINAFDAMK